MFGLPSHARATQNSRSERRYLDFLEWIWHHGDEHINEDDHRHSVVDHEEIFTDALGERLGVPFAYRAELGQTEEGPEERHVTLEYTRRMKQ